LKRAIPNFLTVSRLILLPASLYFFANGSVVPALTTYLFIALTDFWDGYLARRWKVCSNLGIVLDQISDKLVGLGFFFGFTFLKLCPIWFLLLSILNSVFLGFGYLVSQFIPSQSGTHATLKIGKWSTALQYIWIGWLITAESFFGKTQHFNYVKSINQAGFIALAALQIWVFSQYALRMYRNYPRFTSRSHHS